jgi:hypothetical protein
MKLKTIAISIVSIFWLAGCYYPTYEPSASSGAKKAQVKLAKNPEGLTVEQKNVGDRLLNDNKVGAIKHLYVLSPETGTVLLYSAVKGKVTSSGKRLTPRTISTDNGNSGIPFRIGSKFFGTNEVLQDDGTYGDSDPYIYWWDTKGIYHQHFMTGGQIVHVSDQPLRVNPNEIKIDLTQKK